MCRSFKWITLLLLAVLTAVANGAGGSTRDYAWLLFLNVNKPPVVDAGANQHINWATNTVSLSATVTDNPGDTLTYQWSKSNGPGNVSFSAPQAKDTMATFTVTPGTYTLQLSATDNGGLTSSSTVIITFNNKAPLVNAGTDKQLWYPTRSVFLNATASDHPKDTLNYTWSKVSGPGNVTFGQPSSEDTGVTFSLSGVYKLRLRVSDGNLASTDQVAVAIINNAPSVNAGPDKQTTAPDNSVYLNATVSDSTSGNLTYTWTKVSGPGTASFSNPSAVDTNVNMSKTGTYVFRLRVSDGELASTDSVTVSYLPMPVSKINVIVAFGDSITVGFGDSNCIEGFAKACSGYTARLAPKLAGAKNYANSVTIWEEGKGGETAFGGLSRIQGVINSHPGADQYLVQYGTNDAISDPPPSKAVFKSRMSSIAQKINSAAGNPQPVLAKAPWAKGTRSYLNTAIQQYNAAVVELYNQRSYIKIPPPDFYSHFQSHPEQIWSYFMFDIHLPVNQRRLDDLHPKAAGYDAMANIWRSRLTQ